MSAGEHTPGPWKARGTNKYGWFVGVENGATIAEMPRVVHLPDENHANAIVMAAAPDMLEVLETAPLPSEYHSPNGFEVERFLGDYTAWLAHRAAALAKARGES